MTAKLEIEPIRGLPEVGEGDDLGALIAAAAKARGSSPMTAT